MKYQIVPVEPTEEMIVIGTSYQAGRVFIDASGTYKAMLEALPPAPSVEEIKQFILEAGQEIEFASRAHALLTQFEAMEKEDE